MCVYNYLNYWNVLLYNKLKNYYFLHVIVYRIELVTTSLVNSLLTNMGVCHATHVVSGRWSFVFVYGLGKLTLSPSDHDHD